MEKNYVTDKLTTKMYYSVIYEENQKGYLLNTFFDKLHSLELVGVILDDFSENNYELSGKIFIIEDKFRIKSIYNILTHKKSILNTNDYKILFQIELTENSFLYHIETNSEFFDLEKLPRIQDDSVQFISKNLDDEINIGLN